jgi:hypothetical protein
MSKWMKWLLASAVVALVMACVSPRSAEAGWRRWGVGYGGYYGVSPYPRPFAFGHGFYVYPGPVMAGPRPMFGPYSIFYSPRPYLRFYLVP